MELQSTPISQRYSVSFFGCVNAGKSSVVNAFLNQDISVVSSVKGTTTDSVKKTMELLPIGPIVVYDTAGYDDESELGYLRIEKTKEIINKTNLAIIVVDINKGLNEKDNEIIELLKNKNIPYLVVYNKLDLSKPIKNKLCISAKTKENIDKLKDEIIKIAKNNNTEKFIIKDKVKCRDIVILVMPQDESAPKNRLILPQQIVIRELLDCHCIVLSLQKEELKDALNSLNKPPRLVIVDSQVFGYVNKILPKNILLTSFSILFARYKGNLKELTKGIDAISKLEDNDNILISEACTHHRQCRDIGSVQIPKMLQNYTNKKLNFEFSSGNGFPKNLSKYKLIIHCGACMINEAEMKSRINFAIENNIPIVNYGILLAHLNNILKRSLEIFENE